MALNHPTGTKAAKTSVALPPDLKERLEKLSNLTRSPFSSLLIEAAELLCGIAESDENAPVLVPETAVRARVERKLRGIVAVSFKEPAISGPVATLVRETEHCEIVAFPVQA